MDKHGPEADANAGGRPKGSLAIVKPRVLFLLVFSGFTGMMAAGGADTPMELMVWLLVGGVLATASANIFNNILDRERDSLMERTMWRPIPAGRVGPGVAALAGASMGVAGLLVLYVKVNPMTALLTLLGMLFYIVVYTIVLKPRTAENITIGGVAGAFPPMVGWSAITGDVGWEPLLIGLMVILWTPPHFWSLALFHQEDYRRAGVPMLPVVRGERETIRRIVAYAVALALVSPLLYLAPRQGIIYLVGTIALNLPLLYLAFRLMRDGTMAAARRLFAYSNMYLGLLFLLVIVDSALSGPLA